MLRETFLSLLEELEQQVEKLEIESRNEGSPVPGQFSITVLGQMSLFLDEEANEKLHLAATVDLDAKLEGNWIISREFKRLLKEQGLVFDETSTEIWIPEGARYKPFYQGTNIQCDYLRPLDTLVSKAVKAPLKNKPLVKQALQIWGKELRGLIKTHGGDVSLFEDPR